MKIQLMMGISAIALLSTVPASAQEVLMRRPLPSVVGSSSTPTSVTPTPTPSPTPTPTTTPTPGSTSTPAGTSTPTPSPTPTTTPTPTPTPTTTPSPTPTATPTSTAPAATRAYVGTLTCDAATSKYAFQCYDIEGISSDGTYATKTLDATSADCASQPIDSAWQSAASPFRVIAPSDVPAAIAQSGQTCDPSKTNPQPRTVYGALCGTSGPTCQELTYAPVLYGSEANYAYANLISANDASLSKCETTGSLSYADKVFLAEYGYLPGSSDIVTQCAKPSLYGANGYCQTKTSYDPGWPQSGQVHIDTKFNDSCFGLYNVTDPFDPEQMTAIQTDTSFCHNQTPTAAQAAVLAQTAPQYADYQTMDKSCTGGAYLDANYQRALLYHANGTPAEGVADGSNGGYGADFRYRISASVIQGSPYLTAFTTTVHAPADRCTREFLGTDSYTIDLPYTCTDESPDNYYAVDGEPQGDPDASTFPMSAGTCQTEHDQDVQAMQLVFSQDVNEYTTSSVADDPANQVIHVKYTVDHYSMGCL